MSSRTLTLIGAIALTLLAVGCSNSHKVLNPTMSDETQVTTIQTIGEDSILSKTSTPVVERFGFRATLHRIKIEGGCWYLQTPKDDRYEPVFDNEPEVLYDGMELDVYGYADYQTATYCMIGPIFHVEKYQILSKGPAEPSDNSLTIKDKKPRAVDQPEIPPTPIISLIGQIIWSTKENDCIYLVTGADFNYELRFNYVTYPPINPNIKVKVTGRFIPSAISECVGGPVFLVYSVQRVIEEDQLAKPIENQPRLEIAMPKQTAESFQISDPQPIVDHPNVGFLRLQGSFYYTEEGCAYIVTKDRGKVALAFDNQMCPNIPAGARVEVGGNFSLLTVSPCGLGNLFNVLYIVQVKDNNRIKVDGVLAMPN